MRRIAIAWACATLAGGAACAAGVEDDAPSTGWSRFPGGADLGWLLSVWGPSDADVLAVGGRPGSDAAPGRARAIRLDAGAGREIPLPSQAARLNWLFGTASGYAFAVGEAGTALGFDGAEWRVEPTPTPEDLWGVWGASPDEVWAVGGRGRAEGQATLLRRAEGRWSVVPLPELGRPGANALFKVWGSSASDVWVVGQRGVLLHYDGARWVAVDSGTLQDLVSIWGTSSEHVVAVGGRGNGEALVFDGSVWRRHPLSPLPGLNGVWTDAPGSAWIVGEAGTIARLDTGTGEARVESVPLEGEERFSDFHAVFGTSRRLFAVGGNFVRTSGPFVALAFGRAR